MKFEIRELEIEMVPETEHDRDVLEKLHKSRNSVRIKAGRSADRGWPPDSRKTNIIFVLPDPNDWGT